jgi:hypothetical protein
MYVFFKSACCTKIVFYTKYRSHKGLQPLCDKFLHVMNIYQVGETKKVRQELMTSSFLKVFSYILPLGRRRRRWENNIKMGIREIGIDGANWIQLAQDRVQ